MFSLEFFFDIMKVTNLSQPLLICVICSICLGALDPRTKAVLDANLPAYLQLDNLATGSLSTCGGLWHKNGTVCNLTILLAYAKQDAGNLMLAQKDFNNTLRLIDSTIKHVIPKIFRSNNQSIFEQGLPSGANVSSMIFSKICWNRMIKIRSSSLCSTCAGNNFQFYQEMKGGNSMEDCNSLFDTCEKFFRSLSQTRTSLLQLLLWLGRLNPQLKTEVN